MSFRNYQVPFDVNEKFKKKAAYFSMEFAIHQPLKIYSGGLGFLAGSHLRSAYELKQNLIGVGILWKYGYYDQARNQDQTLQVTFMEKIYSFLEDTGIKYQIMIHDHPVWVKAYYLAPNTFCSAPLCRTARAHCGTTTCSRRSVRTAPRCLSKRRATTSDCR